MRAKRWIGFWVAIGLIAALIFPINAFAVWEAPAYLFEADFEAGAYSGYSVSQPRAVHASGLSSAASVWFSGTEAEIKTDATTGNATNFFSFKSNSARYARCWFNEPVENTDSFILEFDAYADEGVKFAVSAIYEDQYDTASNYVVYRKWLMGTGAKNGALACAKVLGSESNGYAYPWSGTSYTAGFKRETSSEDLSYTDKTWHHYKLLADQQNQALTLWVDGVKSETINDINYIGGSNQAVGGIAIHQSDTGIFYLDNLKAYRAETLANYKLRESFENYADMAAYKAAKNVIGGYVDTNQSNALIETDKVNLYASINRRSANYNSNDSNEINTTQYLHFTNSGLPQVIYIPFGAPVSDGKLRIEFDAAQSFYDNKNSTLSLSLLGDGDLGNTFAQSKRSNWIWTASSSVDAVSFYTNKKLNQMDTYVSDFTAEGTESLTDVNGTPISAPVKLWHHYALELDFAGSSAVISIDGTPTEKIAGYEFFGSGEPISGLAFTGKLSYSSANISAADLLNFINIDNLSVYVPSDDQGLTVSGDESTVKVAFNDSVNASTVSAEDIQFVSLDDLSTVSASSVQLAEEDKTAEIQVDGRLRAGQKYLVKLSERVAYQDGYKPYCLTQEFVCQKSGLDIRFQIEDAKFHSGETVKVGYTISAAGTYSETLEMIVAGYKDGELRAVKAERAAYANEVFQGVKKDVELLLDEEIDTIKAFAWNGDMVPFAACEEVNAPTAGN